MISVLVWKKEGTISIGLPCISNDMNMAIKKELMLMRIAAAVYAIMR
jgi:hypothetical protein